MHRRQQGFSLIELLIVMLMISVLSAIAIPLLLEALTRARVASLAADARAVYSAFQRHYVDQSIYPDPAAFQLATLEPLISMEYYEGRVTNVLVNGQADGYDAPDDATEFWLEMTLATDPTVRMLVANSDDAPLGGGSFYDGIYHFRNGVLKPINSRN